METGLYSLAQIKSHLISSIKPKGDICLIFYLKEVGRSGWDSGIESIDFKLERKAIPSYLIDEFYRRHGMSIHVPEKDVLEFIKEFSVNISNEEIDNFIKRYYD